MNKLFVPNYSYIAKSLEGEPKAGILEAKNEHDLAGILRKEGYILISTNVEETTKKKKFAFSISFGGVPLTEKIMFARNLQVMISAGVSLTRALNILSIQTKNKKFSRALKKIEKDVTEGKKFSESLSQHKSIFSELFYSMIGVGEESGTLEEVLGNLIHQMEKEHELKSKIKGAMMYPAVIITAMIGIGILMLAIVVPTLAQTFKDLEIEIPFTTKLVIAIGSFFSTFWYLVPISLVLSIVGLRIAAKTQKGKLLIDSIVLKLPIIAPLIIKTNSAYTARTLGSLIGSGVPIVTSLDLISRSLGNIYYKRAMTDAARQVKKGTKLAEILEKYPKLYPILVTQMIEVGEETGETSKILKKLADFFEEEVANATKNLSSIIEPILMLIIGIAVGFFAISMIQPIYSMLGAIE